MIRLWLAAPLLLLGGPQDGPGPHRGIAGLGGFLAVSRVDFAAEPDRPHRLEAVYVFPDRARWELADSKRSARARQLIYRSGQQAFELAPGQRGSRAHEGRERDTVLLQMELRRAAFLWPDGFPWDPAPVPGRMARAPVFRSEQAAGGEPQRIGELEAYLGQDGRPVRVRALDAAGGAVETLAVGSWRGVHGRLWPAELELRKEGEVVWRETLERVETRVFYVDAFFLPPDRRSGGTVVAGGRTIHALDLQEITARTSPLEARGWEAALADAREEIDTARDELAGLGLEVDPVPTLELDADGAPAHLVLRLTAAVAEPPEGWTRIRERPGLALVLEGPPTARDLALLHRAVPAEQGAGTPYCRVVGKGDAQRYQVYLPLVPDGGPDDG